VRQKPFTSTQQHSPLVPRATESVFSVFAPSWSVLLVAPLALCPRATAVVSGPLSLHGFAFGHCGVGITLNSQFVGLHPRLPQWQPHTEHPAAGNAATSAYHPARALKRHSNARVCKPRPLPPGLGQHRAAWPNPSFNRTRYGRPSWPGRRYAVHFRQPGQAVPPQRAG
jgi:hypothetical protein